MPTNRRKTEIQYDDGAKSKTEKEEKKRGGRRTKTRKWLISLEKNTKTEQQMSHSPRQHNRKKKLTQQENRKQNPTQTMPISQWAAGR